MKNKLNYNILISVCAFLAGIASNHFVREFSHSKGIHLSPEIMCRLDKHGNALLVNKSNGLVVATNSDRVSILYHKCSLNLRLDDGIFSDVAMSNYFDRSHKFFGLDKDGDGVWETEFNSSVSGDIQSTLSE